MHKGKGNEFFLCPFVKLLFPLVPEEGKKTKIRSEFQNLFPVQCSVSFLGALGPQQASPTGQWAVVRQHISM